MTAMSQPAAEKDEQMGDRPFRVTGRMVLVSLIAFFAIVFGVNVFMAYEAIHTFAGVDTDSAYKLGLKYNGDIAEAQAQQNRGWNVSAHIARGADGHHHLAISVRDKAEMAIGGLVAKAQLLHPSQRTRDVTVVLTDKGGGRFEGTFDAAPGQWELEITMTRGDERMFRSRNRVTVQ